MSKEKDPRKSIPIPLTVEQTARLVVSIYRLRPEMMIMLSQAGMKVENKLLFDALEENKDALGKKEEMAAGGLDWFKTGVYFAYLYYEYLARNVEGRKVPEIARDDIARTKEEIHKARGAKILESALLTGEDLRRSQIGRFDELMQDLHGPLRRASMAIMRQEMDEKDGLAKMSSFINGVRVINTFFKPHFVNRKIR